jgi:hypothetical protein
MLLMAILATVMLALGAAGRIAALGLLAAVCANVLAYGLSLSNGFLLVSAIYLMLLGSGALSCWRPEETFLNRRAGQSTIS